MSVELNEITKKLHQNCLNLSLENQSMLNDVIRRGITFTEVASHLIESYGQSNSGILKTMLDEIFVDIHTSVILASGGYLKGASVVLRTSIELGLYLIYFIDHPIEARLWGGLDDNSDNHDRSFSSTLEKVATEEYMNAASGARIRNNFPNIKNNLKNYYRELSERVHGKYRFLQCVTEDKDVMLKGFSTVGRCSFDALLSLSIERSQDENDLAEKVPSLQVRK